MSPCKMFRYIFFVSEELCETKCSLLTVTLFLQEKHPHPRRPYSGLRICAYLPDNRDGRAVLKLLEKAFNEQLLFTVATNKDGEDVVTTASIPLKTHPDGGSEV